MTKTRTTITLPAELLKKAKIDAVEHNSNLSSLIEKLLQLNLEHKLLIQHSQEKKEAKTSKLNQIAGCVSFDMNLSAKQLKKLIMQQYD